MRQALIVIGHFKPAWNELSGEDQAAFAAQVARTARLAGVTPIVGYRLTTQGSFLEVWEADNKETLQAFIGQLAALGYQNYYDEVVMLGERAESWISPEAGVASGRPEPGHEESEAQQKPSDLDGAGKRGPGPKRAPAQKRRR